jgi:hypothetical protein
MLGELANVPTGTLIDMVAIILGGERALTLSDVTELEQIQRELQRRAQDENWNSDVINRPASQLRALCARVGCC